MHSFVYLLVNNSLTSAVSGVTFSSVAKELPEGTGRTQRAPVGMLKEVEKMLNDYINIPSGMDLQP